MNTQDLSILTAAYGLDLLIGDPRWMPHPVRWMGFAIDRGERLLRSWIRWERLAGGILVAVIVGGSYALTWAVLHFSATLSPWLELAIAIFLLFTAISTRDLDVESREVFYALKKNDLPLAREKVSMIVGRDTKQMDEPEIIRATLETVAENTVDGIISPLFYAMLGGVPLAVAYRAVNTLDAMIGHKTPRYILFGRVAARLDHLLNYVPARLSGILFPIAAGLMGFSLRRAWRTAWTDGAKSGHANSGIPEAAMAGALQVQLGGLNFYGGEERKTSLLGTPHHALEAQHILRAIRIMYACSVLTFGFVLAVRGFWL